MNEIWKAIPGFEGLYDASSHGRVRANFPANGGQYRPGRILKTWKVSNGYLHVTLYKMGEHSQKTVHTIILRTFCGDPPKGYECRHYDGNRQNNRLENLSWGTRSQNRQDQRRHGTYPEGEQASIKKLTNAAVVKIREARSLGLTYKAIADSLGVHWSTIWLVVKGKTWKHIP